MPLLIPPLDKKYGGSAKIISKTPFGYLSINIIITGRHTF
jgi:hypothetical protein